MALNVNRLSSWTVSWKSAMSTLLWPFVAVVNAILCRRIQCRRSAESGDITDDIRSIRFMDDQAMPSKTIYSIVTEEHARELPILAVIHTSPVGQEASGLAVIKGYTPSKKGDFYHGLK
ncbi:hypothetical protein QR680_000548 [Steinernema hermaphroditum]|uniref:Uncharacterized protein n=1 Tax=Steinernema hermaphroditum TaxID=289476 RepID=A0AA39GV00_9BILA|nr:hypothetical protein QR680_000548 [Steinernema hermaphroditum]